MRSIAINDEFAPAAAFLGSATVDPNPAHVTYVVDTARNAPAYGIARFERADFQLLKTTGTPKGPRR